MEVKSEASLGEKRPHAETVSRSSAHKPSPAAAADSGAASASAASAAASSSGTPAALQKPPEKKAKTQKKPPVEPEEDSADENFDLGKMMGIESEHVARMNSEQMRRYEFYRRSDLKKEKVKKLLTSLNLIPPSMAPSDPLIIAVKGLTKVFIGELIECALDVQSERGDSGALLPKHVREAYRRLSRAGVIPPIHSVASFPLSPW